MLFVLFAFLSLRILDFMIAFLAPRFVPYLGFFSHPTFLENFNLPSFIKSFANFDGIFYMKIAKDNYAGFEQAFFPLYPLLIRLLSPLFGGSQLIAGLVISNLSFLAGLFVFQKYLKETFRQDPSLWPIIFLLVFPTSFFFGAVYTEGLFFLLVVSSFYFLKKQQYITASLIAALASATRLAGVFLAIPFIVEFFFRHKRFVFHVSRFTLLAPFIGLVSYMIFLSQTVHDPFAFLTSQPAFGANRSTTLVLLPQVFFRYLKILFTASHNLQWWVATLEFATFTIVFVSLCFLLWRLFTASKKDYDMIALSLFSLVNLVLPTATGTFSSIPRYALISLSFFLILGAIKNSFLKAGIALVFLVLHAVLLTFFIQGYFIS